MSCIPISTSSTLCDTCRALENSSPSDIVFAELKQKACTCDPAGWDEESEAEYEAWCIRFADQQNIPS